MKIGIGTYTYTWAIGVPGSVPEHPLTVYSLIRRAADLKVSCVQIGDNLPLEKINPAEFSAIRQCAKDNRVDLEIGGRGLTEKNLDHLIDVAVYMGSPILRMVIDANDYRPDMDTIIAIIANAVKKLESAGIILALENHDRFHAWEFRKIVEISKTNFTGICLDCVNSMGIGEGIDTVLEQLAPFTVNLHVKDFKIRRVSHKMGFIIEGAPAGKGFLDLPRILDKLLSYGKCRSAILELWTTPADTLEETIKREEEWALESIKYLKETISPSNLP